MLITKVKKISEDGSVEATLKLSEEQTAFLLNFAIGYLTNIGLAEVVEIEEQQEPTTASDAPVPSTDNNNNGESSEHPAN